MKPIKLMLVATLLSITGIVFSQGRVVINNDAYIVINNNASVVLDNPNSNAITVTGTGGNIVSEAEKDIVKWNIGNSIGNYIIPYTTVNNVKIPFTINLNSPGDPIGHIVFSTFPVSDSNKNYPTGVSDMATICKSDNSLETVDRFWRIDASSYSTKPSPTISFGYDDGIEETGGDNTIDEVYLRAQRYNSMLNLWEVPVKLFGTVDTSNNAVNNANVTTSDFFEFWTLSSTFYLTTNDTIYVQTYGNTQTFCLTQDELQGGIYSYSFCKPASQGVLSNYNDTCFNYVPITNKLDTACIVIEDLCLTKDTTIVIFVPPIKTDTLYTFDTVACVDTTQMYNGYHTITTCDGMSMTNNGGSVSIDLKGCVTVSPVFRSGISDTTCIVVCDSILRVCDTTIIITVSPSKTDSIAIPLNLSSIGVICLPQNELPGTSFTYYNCNIPSYGTVVNYNDTCFTYTQTSISKYLDTTCIVICDEHGLCDTTILIYVPTPDPDSIFVGPVSPVTNVTTCVNLESTFMTGSYVGTCDGSGTTSLGVPVTITGLCVRYPVPVPAYSGDTLCIVVCDTIRNVIICDTTTVIYLPDVTAPTLLCKNDTVYLNSSGTAIIDTSNTILSIYDNTLINAVWNSNLMFNCSNVGTNPVTVFARDTNNNQSSCVSTITVLDTVSPMANCQNITIRLDNVGVASIVAADVNAGSTDNCRVASVVVNQTNFDCSHLGMNTVMLTVTDIYGNVSTCTSVVTVEDLNAPIVSCPSGMERVIKNRVCAYKVEDFTDLVSSQDNCDVNSMTYTQSPMAGDEVILNNETLVVTLTGTDGSGNSSICTFEVYVKCKKEIDIPQFISPNADGSNDTWEIPQLQEFPDNVVKVFNRWGSLVFEQKGYYTGWDGSSNINNGINRLIDNKTLPNGTYFYVIDLGESGFEPYVGYMQLSR